MWKSHSTRDENLTNTFIAKCALGVRTRYFIRRLSILLWVSRQHDARASALRRFTASLENVVEMKAMHARGVIEGEKGKTEVDKERRGERKKDRERQGDAKPRRRLDVLCAPRKRCLWILNSFWNSHSGSKMARTRRILRLNDVLSEFCMPLRPRAAHPGPYGRLYVIRITFSLFSFRITHDSVRNIRASSHRLFFFLGILVPFITFRQWQWRMLSVFLFGGFFFVGWY